MPQESYCYSSIFSSPNRNLRGLKGLNNTPHTEDIISDRELAQRKAEEAASRRNQAVQWLQQMDWGASEVLPEEPSEEDFCLALRNGLILCNVLNKVDPGAVVKVVENPVLNVEATEAAAQSAIQYFENMRNFLLAVARMKLLTFGASDLEKGGSSGKVVDCILCLKGYYEWKQSGGIGVWKYGGTVRITSLAKESSPSVVSSESPDESVDGSESSMYEELMEFLHSLTGSDEEARAANVLTFAFDHFSLGLLQSYLTETNGFDDSPSSSMAIDIVLAKVVKDFIAVLMSQSKQLGSFFKNVLDSDSATPAKTGLLEAISKYLSRSASLVSQDISKLCYYCNGKSDVTWNSKPHVGVEFLDMQQKQLEELKVLFKETRQEVHRYQLEWEEEVKGLGQHVKGLEVAAVSYHKIFDENRFLYNQVQDLKGTIRVYCRVRPFLTGQPNEETTVDYIGDNGSIMIVNPLKQGKDARRVFSFNKVYGTDATQQNVYADAQSLVRSVLDGFNVCVFAYGQTGSGKTYTMSGPDIRRDETWGVNYRALRDLFEVSKARTGIVEYEVGVQMIEIYNEQVRDLLVSDGSNRRLDIRNSSQLNGLNVPDASLVRVGSTQEVLDIMRIGQGNRAVGATALNVRSSRSHSIVTVHVRGKERVSGTMLKGCLHLVDLAGSERVEKSEAVGERLKEAQHINRSLSALGDVVAALAQKSSHVPYRNSKLTQVLQDSLGGNAKTLMFVHINPEANALGETISTLKFAERVSTINIGEAQSNKETGEIREFKDEISSLKLALERKEAELEQLRSRTSIRGGVSPLRLPKSNSNAISKPDGDPQQFDTHSTEVRSCSTSKQRRSPLPSKFTDKDVVTKGPFVADERSARSMGPRSISTDRASVIRPTTKPDRLDNDNQPIVKAPFPSSLSVNKSVAGLPSFIPSALSSHRVTLQRVKPENGEERQGGIRRTKQDKAKIKQEKLSSDAAKAKMQEEAEKVDFSDHENDNESACGTTRFKPFNKLHRNYLRNSQNVEPRYIS